MLNVIRIVTYYTLLTPIRVARFFLDCNGVSAIKAYSDILCTRHRRCTLACKWYKLVKEPHGAGDSHLAPSWHVEVISHEHQLLNMLTKTLTLCFSFQLHFIFLTSITFEQFQFITIFIACCCFLLLNIDIVYTTSYVVPLITTDRRKDRRQKTENTWRT